jgi:tRNA(adenine34) deaminase
LKSETETETVHESWMREALILAETAQQRGEVPVGALLVRDGKVLGRGFNQPISQSDPTAHAEIQAIRGAAAQEGNYRLPNSTLYVTVEPCSMCAGALVHARISHLVFGAREPRAGAVLSTLQVLSNPNLNHRVGVTEGVLADECGALISSFFRERRN